MSKIDDEDSVASSVTDMTDNTANHTYHNEDNSVKSDASSLVSNTSVNSIKESDIKEMLDSGMSKQDIQKNLSITAAHIKMKANQKADRVLALSLKFA